MESGLNDISSELSQIELAIRESVEPPAQWFADQVEGSKSDPAQMALWTSSTVIDDNVQGAVFGPEVFSWIHEGAPGSYDFPVGHAGLMHTYGYLLSTVVTPYGLKSQRWLTTDLAEAFGVDPHFFHPTYSTVPLMERVASKAMPILTNPGGSRTVFTVDEVIDHRSRMRTVYVSNPMTHATAVVYGVVTGDRAQIVSTFPVGPLDEEFVRGWLTKPMRYRYNYAPPRAEPGSEIRREPDYR